MATGVAVAIAALGIGLGVWFGLHAGEGSRVIARETYPVPGPTITVTPEPKPFAVRQPIVTDAPSVSPIAKAEPSIPPDPHTPVVNYTKFASQKIALFGHEWDLQAGHQFASETQTDWDAAWCYLSTDIGGITARVDLANRQHSSSSPIGPIAPSDVLQRIGLDEQQASELAAQCPWLDGKQFSAANLVPVQGRIASPALSPAGGLSPAVAASAPPTPNLDFPTFEPKPFSINDGYDATGNDLPGMPLDSASVDECQQNCAQNFSCNAFTYNKRHNKCFLKDKARILVANMQGVAGYKRGSGGSSNLPPTSELQIHSKSAVTGRPYRGAVLPSFDVCLLMCERESAYCLGVNYDLSTSECNLFGSVTGVVTAPTMLAGERPVSR